MKKKAFALLISLVMMLSLSLFVSAEGIPDTRQCPRLTDSADLIPDSDEEFILTLLDGESEENQFDFVIHTTDSVGGMQIENYADDYFDYNGFGYGENGDGVILVVAMDIREYYISTCGRGIELFSDEAVDYCENAFVSYLSSGDYSTAFNEFLTASAEVVEKGIDNIYGTEILPGFDFDYGYDYDDDYEYTYAYPELGILEKLGISLLIGFIIAGVVAFIHVSKLKSVRSQKSAANYVKEGSFRLSHSSDRFLYRHVTKRRKPKDTGSGGRGGGVRMGSSGRSHGGGGGKF